MESLRNELVLVTGASGFVASHCVKRLLEVGARVRGTVRNLQNEQKVAFLRKLPFAAERLELIQADLLDDISVWKKAVQGCKYVLHVASPFPLETPKDPNDLIKPALEGTLSVLNACAESTSTVKRVVITSSIVAVYDASVPIPKEYEETKTLNEECWTDGDNVNIEPYARSKALAEKAAWNFVNELPSEKKFELATINPGLVLGPLLSDNDSTSAGMIKKLLDREMPALCKLNCPIVDVRDVAECHLKALVVDEAAANRHLVVAKSVWLKDVAMILHKEFKQYGYNIPRLVAPNFVVWFGTLFDTKFKAAVPRLGREYHFNNDRMQNVLQVTPIDVEKTVIDTAHSLIDLEVVKPRRQRKNETNDESQTESTSQPSSP